MLIFDEISDWLIICIVYKRRGRRRMRRKGVCCFLVINFVYFNWDRLSLFYMKLSDFDVFIKMRSDRVIRFVCVIWFEYKCVFLVVL